MEFVAVLKPDEKCKRGCNGNGILKHIPMTSNGLPKKQEFEHGKRANSVEIICACCKVTVLSKDPDEALKKLAEITGREIKSSSIISTSDFTPPVVGGP